ncbi:MAG TPA: hypothetical protein PLO65_17295 [Caulobacter sp.]|nr:hypothetical protein [Caulobacter sp.]
MTIGAAITVLVVLDPDFGDHLVNVPSDQPVWIVESLANTPAARRIWSDGVERTGGVTLFKSSGDTRERVFRRQLGVIDLHHGPYSSDESYTGIKVIGASLTGEIEASLLASGFAPPTATADGFKATRSRVEAQRLR